MKYIILIIFLLGVLMFISAFLLFVILPIYVYNEPQDILQFDEFEDDD